MQFSICQDIAQRTYKTLNKDISPSENRVNYKLDIKFTKTKL